jgi:hypothetical protein
MISAMERPELAGRDIRIGGPQTVNLQQLTDKLSIGWNRPLKCEHQTVDDFCNEISNTMQGRGLETDRIIKQMYVNFNPLFNAQIMDANLLFRFKAYTYYNSHPEFEVDMEPVLEELPAQLTTIEDWASRHPVPGWK